MSLRLIHKFFCPNHQNVDYFQGDKIANLQCSQCETLLERFHAHCFYCGSKKNYGNFRKHQKKCGRNYTTDPETIVILIGENSDLLDQLEKTLKKSKIRSLIVCHAVGDFNSLKFQLENHPCRFPYRPIRKIAQENLKNCISLDSLQDILFLFVCKEMIPEYFDKLMKMDLNSPRTYKETAHVPSTVQRSRKTEVVQKNPNDLIFDMDVRPIQKKLVLVFDPKNRPTMGSGNVVCVNGEIPIDAITKFIIHGNIDVKEEIPSKSLSSPSQRTINTKGIATCRLELGQHTRDSRLAPKSPIRKTYNQSTNIISATVISQKEKTEEIKSWELNHHNRFFPQYQRLWKQRDEFLTEKDVIRKTLIDFDPQILIRFAWYFAQQLVRLIFCDENPNSVDYIFLKPFNVNKNLLNSINSYWDNNYHVNEKDRKYLTMNDLWNFFNDILKAPLMNWHVYSVMFPPRYQVQELLNSIGKLDSVKQFNQQFRKIERHPPISHLE